MSWTLPNQFDGPRSGTTTLVDIETHIATRRDATTDVVVQGTSVSASALLAKTSRPAEKRPNAWCKPIGDTACWPGASVIVALARPRASSAPANPESNIKMTLTSQACPEARTIPEVMKRRILDLDGVSECEIDIVWEPQWSPQLISPAGREILGIEDPAPAPESSEKGADNA